jgi:hypothetical protein
MLMPLELVNTFATFGTFLMIAGTAIAAVVQLSHARSSNQIEALAELRQEAAGSEMVPALRFVRFALSAKMRDPAFRYQRANPKDLTEENTLALYSTVLPLPWLSSCENSSVPPSRSLANHLEIPLFTKTSNISSSWRKTRRQRIPTERILPASGGLTSAISGPKLTSSTPPRSG